METRIDFIIKIIGILVVASILTLIVGGFQFDYRIAITNLLYTVAYWEGSWRITGYFRRKYDTYSQTKYRIIYQLLSITAYVVLVNLLLMILVTQVIFPELTLTLKLYLGNLLVSLFITYLISSIYEAQCFFDLWKTALKESAQLKERTLKAQLETLKNQVNPHFLFNSLNTLSAIIPEEPEKAVVFVQKLSQLYRYLLQHRDKDTVDLETELESISSYLFLQAMRFGDKLTWSIDVDPKLTSFQLPPLSLQLLVENAVKHNIISEGYPLELSISSAGEELIVRNSFQPKRSVEPSTQVGLNNLKERYRLLGQNELSVNQDDHIFEVRIPLIQPT